MAAVNAGTDVKRTAVDARPIIGLSPHRSRERDRDQSIPDAYIDALVAAGAVPLVLPLVPSESEANAPLLDICDGFLLTGSVANVHPSRYGGEKPEGGFCDERRDGLDVAVLAHAEATGRPVFGVCRGCQMMNVYRGGTLAWHYRSLLPETPIEHNRDDPPHSAVHTVTWESGAWMANEACHRMQPVNSMHDQVCVRLGRDLRAAALSEDGLIEAIEDLRTPERFFAVQWHPELLATMPGIDEATRDAARRLFARFVQACRA